MKKLILVSLVFFGAVSLARQCSFSYEPIANMGSFMITIGAVLSFLAVIVACKAIKG